MSEDKKDQEIKQPKINIAKPDDIKYTNFESIIISMVKIIMFSIMMYGFYMFYINIISLHIKNINDEEVHGNIKDYNIFVGDKEIYKSQKSDLCSLCLKNDRQNNFIIPSIKNIGLYIRRLDGKTLNILPSVFPLSDEDIMKGGVNGRSFQNIFDIMSSYIIITQRACLSYHHLSGYKGNPRNMMVFLTNGGRTLTRAMNVTIDGQSSKGTVEFGYNPTQCPKKVFKIKKFYKIKISYIEYTDTISDDDLHLPTIDKTHLSAWIEGIPALCIQVNLDEMSGTDLCNNRDMKNNEK